MPVPSGPWPADWANAHPPARTAAVAMPPISKVFFFMTVSNA
jgi:hypothetical protein